MIFYSKNVSLRPYFYTYVVFSVFSLCISCSAPEVDPAPRSVPEPIQTRTWSLGPVETPPDAEDIDPSPDVVHVVLEPTRMVSAEGEEMYGYNGLRPGPTIRAKVGDTVRVDVRNALDSPTTVHWHGLKVPFAMDGVVWRGAPIEPGGSFTYSFKVESSGTFWYHPHFNTSRQVDLGLYGALVVESLDEPRTDRELTLLLDTPDEFETPSVQHGHGRRMRMWTVNGHVRPSLAFRRGESVRVRLINVSNHGYVDLSARDGALDVLAFDQGLLSGAPHGRDRVLLAPGDRAELVWSVGEVAPSLVTTPYTLNGGPTLGEPMPLFDGILEGELEGEPSALVWPSGEVQAPTPDPTFVDIVYVFSGSDRTGRWLINGEIFPDVTIREVPFNSWQIVEVRNLSPTEHPFHVHGLHFEVLSIDGTAPRVRTIEDTINLPIRSTVRLRILADNAGDWMTHCHILPHADGGMMTVLRVLDAP